MLALQRWPRPRDRQAPGADWWLESWLQPKEMSAWLLAQRVCLRQTQLLDQGETHINTQLPACHENGVVPGRQSAARAGGRLSLQKGVCSPADHVLLGVIYLWSFSHDALSSLCSEEEKFHRRQLMPYLDSYNQRWHRTLRVPKPSGPSVSLGGESASIAPRTYSCRQGTLTLLLCLP